MKRHLWITLLNEVNRNRSCQNYETQRRRKSIYAITVLLIVFVTACSVQRNDDGRLLGFENARIIVGEKNLWNEQGNGWYLPYGQAAIDTLNLYEGEKSLLLSASQDDTTQRAEIYYFAIVDELEGDSIRFTGKYKSGGTENATITFSIRQYSEEDGFVYSTTDVRGFSNTAEWTDFAVETSLHKATCALLFVVNIQGNTRVNISHCEVGIDKCPLKEYLNVGEKVKKDTAFDEGSNVSLGPLSSQMIDNLEVLGKVWGFLKYYHPAITEGNYNWDYELFRVLPRIANAKDKKERDRLLNKWVDTFGEITEGGDYAISDSSNYSRIIDLSWLDDDRLFDQKLITKLDRIKNAKRSNLLNYYYIPFMYNIGRLFERENPYLQVEWSDQGFRILTLYRFWNAMEYCFPYVEMTDKPWSTLLKEYIPRFISPKNKTDYDLALLELGSNINDSHGSIQLSTPDLRKMGLARHTYRSKIPVLLKESKAGDIVVQETQTYELERGDIIRKVEGEDVRDLIERLSPYVIASNRSSLIRTILSDLLSTDNTLINITCIRNGKEQELTLRNFMAKKNQEMGRKPWQAYNLDSKQIAYLDLSSMDNEAVAHFMKQNRQAKGLIIDLRKRPESFSFAVLDSFLMPKKEDFMWFSKNEKCMPGNYKLHNTSTFGRENPDYYQGKVVILVNEETQSYGEFSAMAYRKAPQSVIIGSTTAGADGNIGYFYLPGNIRVTYTALGAYYPYWKLCQRKGVDIDMEVLPTTEDISKGQDVWIEKAIEYIGDCSESTADCLPCM